jgi:hypothetical protein
MALSEIASEVYIPSPRLEVTAILAVCSTFSADEDGFDSTIALWARRGSYSAV